MGIVITIHDVLVFLSHQYLIVRTKNKYSIVYLCKEIDGRVILEHVH